MLPRGALASHEKCSGARRLKVKKTERAKSPRDYQFGVRKKGETARRSTKEKGWQGKKVARLCRTQRRNGGMGENANRERLSRGAPPQGLRKFVVGK